MEWLYILGIGTNGYGYMQFIHTQNHLDNTPALEGIKNISPIVSLVILAIGFAVFDWWVPLVGLVPAQVAIGLLLSKTPIAKNPQVAIILGGLLSIISLAVA